jgi:hypothetical protein
LDQFEDGRQLHIFDVLKITSVKVKDKAVPVTGREDP